MEYVFRQALLAMKRYDQEVEMVWKIFVGKGMSKSYSADFPSIIQRLANYHHFDILWYFGCLKITTSPGGKWGVKTPHILVCVQRSRNRCLLTLPGDPGIGMTRWNRWNPLSLPTQRGGAFFRRVSATTISPGTTWRHVQKSLAKKKIKPLITYVSTLVSQIFMVSNGLSYLSLPLRYAPVARQLNIPYRYDELRMFENGYEYNRWKERHQKQFYF